MSYYKKLLVTTKGTSSTYVIGPNCATFQCHSKVSTVFLNRHISELGNNVPYYFTSLEIFLSVNEMSLNPLHLSLFHAGIHFWNMALLFKRDISINLNATTFSASAFHNFQRQFCEQGSLEVPPS